MGNTFSHIYIHTVFAVKNPNALISPVWEVELFKYISGIARNKRQKVLAINGTSNHIHFLIEMTPTISVTDLVTEIQDASTKFVRERNFTSGNFEWQEGYGVFSCGQSNLFEVIQNIRNQKEHHKKQSFKEEYIGLLKAFEIEYQEEFLFDWLPDA